MKNLLKEPPRDVELVVEPVQHCEQGGLRRDLNNRHIQMISLGGTIGVGLFLGSAGAIRKAGPGLILTYIVAGIAIFFVLRALGEMALRLPETGSFSAYATEYIGPSAGFLTGWTYWFTWIAAVTAEITAIGVYVSYWAPSFPKWITALIVVGVLLGANMLSVKIFGEIEFWFAAVKVATIVALIAIGISVLLFATGALGGHASVTNLWSHGGFFPTGISPVILALQIVIYAFFGLEIIGITAGETADPRKVLPSAINRIGLRIGVFYIGSLLVVMSLIPWNEIDPTMSPFVAVFAKVGIPAAASIVNFVVITAAFSSGNSAIFATGRMLYSLSKIGQAPAAISKINSRGVPAVASCVSIVCLLLAVLVNYLSPGKAFIYLSSIATFGALWTWGVIVVAHLFYRHRVKLSGEKSSFKMPWSPLSNIFVLLFFGLVICALATSHDTRIALYVGPIWLLGLLVVYMAKIRRPKIDEKLLERS